MDQCPNCRKLLWSDTAAMSALAPCSSAPVSTIRLQARHTRRQVSRNLSGNLLRMVTSTSGGTPGKHLGVGGSRSDMAVAAAVQLSEFVACKSRTDLYNACYLSCSF